jgi:hypothetical protein
VTALDPEQRPSAFPLPPSLAEIEEQLARMDAEATARFRADLAAAEEAYQALPWWRKARFEIAGRLPDVRRWLRTLDLLRWRIRYRIHTGRSLPRHDNPKGTT